MPRLTRWWVRTAMGYLLFGFALGGVLLSAKGGAVSSRVWLWLPAHVDALIAGWMIQLAMGMAFWILPRRHRLHRGRTPLAWAAYGLMNAGLLIAIGLPWLRYWLPDWAWLNQAFPLGLALQVIALVVFITYAWQRVASPTHLPKT